MKMRCQAEGIYYPDHDVYTGPRSDLAGRCSRCREILDDALAAAGDRETAAEAARRAAEQRRLGFRETEADRRLLGR